MFRAWGGEVSLCVLFVLTVKYIYKVYKIDLYDLRNKMYLYG